MFDGGSVEVVSKSTSKCLEVCAATCQEVGHSIGDRKRMWALIRKYGIENLFLRMGLT